jgi:hypothetical protein
MWEAAGFLGMSVAVLEKTYGHHHPNHLQNAARGIGYGTRKRVSVVVSVVEPKANGVKSAKSRLKSWWARQDSNLQPSGYEPLALTIELRARRRGTDLVPDGLHSRRGGP